MKSKLHALPPEKLLHSRGQTGYRSRWLLSLLLCLLGFLPAQADWKGYLSSSTGGTEGFHLGWTKDGVSSETLNASHPYIDFVYANAQKSGDWDWLQHAYFYWVCNDGNEYAFIEHYKYGDGVGSYGIDNGSFVNYGELDIGSYVKMKKIRAYPSDGVLNAHGGVKGIRLRAAWTFGDTDNFSSGHALNIDKVIYFKYENINYPKPTYTRTKPGEITFSVSGVPDNSGRVYGYNSYKTSKHSDSEIYGYSQWQNATSFTNVVGTGLSNKNDIVVYPQAESYADISAQAGTVHSSFRQYLDPITIKGLAFPSNLTTNIDIWHKKVVLNWQGNIQNRDAAGKWHVFRVDSKGNYTLLATLDVGTTTWTDESSTLAYDATYNYIVAFYKDSWSSSFTGNHVNDLKLISDLTAEKTITLTREISITPSIVPKASTLDLTWKYASVPTSDYYNKTPTFYIERSTDQKTWTALSTTFPVNNAETLQQTYSDATATGSCTTYYYRIRLDGMGTQFYSDVVSGNITDATKVTEVTTSKGTYSGLVKVNWKANQVGTGKTKFLLQRRLAGGNSDWGTIYTTQGTDDAYYFEDNTAAPGSYYEYKVSAYSQCSGTYQLNNSLSEVGFSQTTGLVSGRVSYGTGVAVPGVRVNLMKNVTDSTVEGQQFKSLYITGLGGGVRWKVAGDDGLDKTKTEALFLNKPFTFQMWINPDARVTKSAQSTVLSEPMMLDAYNAFSLNLQHQSDSTYLLGVHLQNSASGATSQWTNLTVKANEWANIFISTDGQGTWTVGKVADGKVTTWSTAAKAYPLKYWHYAAPATESTTEAEKEAEKIKSGIAFGTNLSNDPNYTYKGYIDEIRLWDHQLSEKELLNTYDRLLAGSEKGLKLYYPLDEGMNYAFDMSKSGGIPNENHGVVAEGTNSSSNVPSARQFGLYGLTDSIGNYTIAGVPFSSEGTSYTVSPALGTHKFNPTKINRFVSANALTHNGVNFEDQSSFLVSGKVYYAGTAYPVSGVTLYVDGVVASKNGEAVVTDDEGAYSISVPIGEHFVSIKKTGHVFVGAGRYPTDPGHVDKLITFDQALSNVNFYDSTMVVVSGRICGGDIEKEKPVGFRQSTNNIGKVKLTLKAGYPMNVVNKVNGTVFSMEDNTVNVLAASPTDSIQSRTYRMKANTNDVDAVKKIEITTDSLTGEFAALLPPVLYNVDKMEVLSNSAIQLDGFVQIIDASNPLLVQKDSMETSKGAYSRFAYNQKYLFAYHSAPVFTVTQKGNPANAFGISSYNYEDIQGKVALKDIYTVATDGTVTYKYNNRPLFRMSDKYTFNLKAFESYVNKDAETPVTAEVPLSGTIVTIANAMSSTQKVYVEAGTVDGQDVKAGDIKDLQENQIELDSLGKATYTWAAGYPNVASPYTRSLTMTYAINNKPYSWMIGDSIGIRGIILGEMPTGSNFVTSGPDKVEMVLRDPPGTGSSATWSTGTTVTSTSTSGGAFVTNNEINTVSAIGYKTDVIHGTPGYGIITEVGSTVDLTVGVNVNVNTSSNNSWSTTTTTSREISTSSEPEFVGATGDVFIGNATNIIFGDANQVGFKRNASGVVDGLGLNQVTTTGLSFGTSFNYTQNYVENTLIPNLLKLRNNKIQVVQASQLSSYVNNTNQPIYITTLSKDDEKFGSNNSDNSVWGSQAVKFGLLSGPSYRMVLPAKPDPKVAYQDSIVWINNQIANWKQTLSDNEKAKVEAIDARETYLDKNYSFDAGASITGSTTVENSHEHSTDWSVETLAVIGAATGFEIAGTGVTASIQTTTGGTASGGSGSSTTTSNTTSYSLVETGDDDALTVDVMKAPDGFGPIFRTRGGQTSCPYEGATVTKYYRPGTIISTATQQIEKPQIGVDVAEVTDVPSGSAAAYTLSLSNVSETGEDVYFNLIMMDETNPNGAKISIDGQQLTSGRTIKVPSGQTVKKAVQLIQTDPSVLDYQNIGLVLASQCQQDPTSTWDLVSDTVYLSAHFVPSSSPVTLSIEKTTMNIATGNTLALTIKDFDRKYRGFKALRLQYKYAGNAEWTTAKEYVLNASDKTQSNELIPTTGNISINFPMSPVGLYPDGNYTFRVTSVATYGNGEIYRYSTEVPVVKDLARPQVLGSTNPSNGILTADNNISVKFNEDIRNGALASDYNFLVTGVMNNAAIDNSVGLQLNGTAAPVSTEAAIDLSSRSFAMDMWLNHKGAGTIVSHGTKQNNFSLAVNAANQAVLSIGGQTYTSTATIPADKWVFLTFNYDKTANGNLFSAMVANANSQDMLFNAISVPAYTGNGRIAMGDNLTGAIHEVTLWNRARTTAEAQSGMYEQKSASTANLIGYWKMDEGHGLKATDAARSRSMVLGSESWYLNNKNFAAELTNSHYLAMNISAASVGSNDSYAAELWFKGAKQTNATLFSVGEQTLGLGFNANGRLSLTSNKVSTELSTTDYLDNNWHHVALNVVRGGSAIVYVDGTAVKVMPESSVTALSGDQLTVGANRYKNDGGTYSYRNYFTGSVDEVRLWNAALSGKYLTENRYNRVDTAKVAGLVAYYPMEITGLDSGNQLSTTFSLTNACAQPGTATTATGTGVTAAANAPSLKDAPKATNVNFTYSASEREIYINLNDTALARLEGSTVNIVLRKVVDMNNNLVTPIVWSAYVNRNGLLWSENQMTIEKDNESSKTFTATIENKSSKAETWSLTGLPTWLTADATQGVLDAASKQTITFTVSAATPIGSYDETVYLTGNEAISEALNLAVKVKGNEPAWSVDASKYEWSMNLTGQLYVKGKMSENADSKVAAFVDGECVGLASPRYIPTRDGYYVLMTIYGATTSANKPVSFKVWDASTGIIYPDITVSTPITFKSDGIYGNMDTPVTLTTTDNIEQNLALQKGWNWTSYYVQPTSTAIANVLKPIVTTVSDVKDKTSFAQSNGTTWSGSLTTVEGGKMYKMYATAATNYNVQGLRINATTSPQTILNMWNWVGNKATANLSPDEAFASMAPTKNDLVKSQTDFAIYNGAVWEGSLEVIKPGCGYLYYSQATGNKELKFPATVAQRPASSFVKARSLSATYYNPVAVNLYPSNMTIVAKLVDADLVIDTAEVAAFVGTECRGVARVSSTTSGLYFLTIAGNGTGDAVKFKTIYKGEERTIDTGLTYSDDAMLGTLTAPYILNLDVTGISTATASAVNVFPTVTKGNVTVESGSTINTITVYDLNGRSVMTQTVNATCAALNLTDFAGGNYVVSVALANGKVVNKQIMKR